MIARSGDLKDEFGPLGREGKFCMASMGNSYGKIDTMGIASGLVMCPFVWPGCGNKLIFFVTTLFCSFSFLLVAGMHTLRLYSHFLRHVFTVLCWSMSCSVLLGSQLCSFHSFSSFLTTRTSNILPLIVYCFFPVVCRWIVLMTRMV